MISLTGAAMVRFTLPVTCRRTCCSDVSSRRSLFVWVLTVLASAWQAPTLNPAALSSDKGGLVDRLLLRSIPRPTHRSVFVGDVVAFHSPLAPVTEQVNWSPKGADGIHVLQGEQQCAAHPTFCWLESEGQQPCLERPISS